MQFLATLISHLSTLGLFGLIILLGLTGGSIASRFRYLPIIFGYLAIGFLIGPHGFNIVNQSLMSDINFFVEISLGLIMFELGRHLDMAWLRHDRGLFYMGMTESSLTFILIFMLLLTFKLPWENAALAAAIAIASSPAIVMMTAHHLSSEGPVTRRTLILTSLNNLAAMILFSLFLPLTHSSAVPHALLLEYTFYRLLGSFALGITAFYLIKIIALCIGKQKEMQFALFIGTVILTISLSRSLNLFTMLSLFTMGVAARNLDIERHLTEVDFGWTAQLFLILLFVTTGIHLQLTGLWTYPLLIIAFLIIRLAAKSAGIVLFSKSCQLTDKQTAAVSLALTPMAGAAITMSNTVTTFNPQLGAQLELIITTIVTLLNITGPIAVQLAFLKTGEAHASAIKGI